MTIRTIEDQLQAIEVGNYITFFGHDPSVVIGTIAITSLETENASQWKTRHEDTYKVICLADGEVLAYFPTKEQGPFRWFLFNSAEAANISQHIQPSAVDFGKKKQGVLGETHFDWIDGQSYKMLDIGRQTWKAEGNGFFREGNGECRHVLATSYTQKGRYMLILDSTSGPGSDTLMYGSIVNPDDVIKTVQ